MNKDFWERIDDLEKIAKLFLEDRVSCMTYGGTANPAMILEMIEEMRRLSSKIIEEQKRSERTENNNVELRNKLIQLEKEANWLATFCTDLCPNVPYHVNCQSCDNCPGGIDCKNSDKPEEWRKLVKKMVEGK